MMYGEKQTEDGKAKLAGVVFLPPVDRDPHGVVPQSHVEGNERPHEVERVPEGLHDACHHHHGSGVEDKQVAPALVDLLVIILLAGFWILLRNCMTESFLLKLLSCKGSTAM